MISLRRSLAWTSLTQATLFVIHFGVTIIVARLLDPYEMGIFVVAMSIVGLLSIIRSASLSTYLIRAPSWDPAVVATVFTVNAAMACLLALALVILGELGGALLSEPRVQQVLLWLAILPLISIFELLPFAGMERRGNFRLLGLLGIAKNLSGAAATVAFAVAGHSYMSLAYGLIIGTLVSLALSTVFGWRDVSLRLGLTEWREVSRFGLQMMALSGTGALATRISELLLSRLQGLAALGLYSRASGLTNMIWENLHLVLVRVLFVDFAEQRRQNRSLRYSYLRITRMLVALLWPMLVGLALYSETTIRILYGANWTAAAMPLSLLALGGVVSVPLLMTTEIFVVHHETRRQLHIEWIRAAVGLTLFTLGCLVSLTWAAAARVAEAVFALVIYRSHIERMTDTRFGDFLPIYGEGAMLTAAATLPSLLLLAYVGLSAVPPVPAVFGAIGLGVILWLLTLWAIKHPLFDEGRRLLGRPAPRPA